MYQIRLGVDEFDSTIEYQINWFMDCSDTLIHNHRHEFYSLCLEGQYTEQLWKITPTTADQLIYRFRRVTPEQPIEKDTIEGVLEPDQVRHHFPGNVLHVVPSLYHSISGEANSSTKVLTFLRKTREAELPCTTFLSSTATIEEQKYQMRPAHDDERTMILEKLSEILEKQHRQTHYMKHRSNSNNLYVK